MPLEQRRSPRVPLSAEVMVYHESRQLLCDAANVSRTGMLLFPRLRLNAGRFMRVVFALPGGADWVEVEAIQIRQALEQPALAWGIQFVNAPEQALRLLDQYVEALGGGELG